MTTEGMGRSTSIPNMSFINRELPIADVGRALDLRFDGTNKIHCWHPERHQHSDRTASVGIRASNNTVKCFGCDSRPMGPIDLVLDVLGLDNPADAALWIAERFLVPRIPARKRLADQNRPRKPVGYERGLGLLIHSGLWAQLSGPAKAVAPVLLEFAERRGPMDDVWDVKMAYLTISRLSGIKSPNAIRKAVLELSEIGFLLPLGEPRRHLDRRSASYTVTPNSQQLWELAQAAASQQHQEIAAETELRKRDRNARLRSKRARTEKQHRAEIHQPTAINTKYKDLYSGNSVKRGDAI